MERIIRKKWEILIVVILMLCLSLACKHKESSIEIEDTKISISGNLIDLNLSKKLETTGQAIKANKSVFEGVAGVYYIAAIPTSGDEGTYYHKVAEDGSFLFPIDKAGNYIFKLLDEYGLPIKELSFGKKESPVLGVYAFTDFGDIYLGSSGSEVEVKGLSGVAKKDSGLIPEVVHQAIKDVIEVVIEQEGLGQLEKVGEEEKLTLLVQQEAVEGKSIEESVELGIDKVIGSYGDVNFLDTIKFMVAVIHEDKSKEQVVLYTNSNYLSNDNEDYIDNIGEEIIKIKELIVGVKDEGSQASKDFKDIVQGVKEDKTLDVVVGESINTADYEVMVDSFEEDANHEIMGDLVSIEIAELPTKIYYTKGQELDISGLVVKGIYSNKVEVKRTIDLDKLTVSGFDSNLIGEQTIKVTYLEKEATFNVRVSLNPEVVSIIPSTGSTGVATDSDIVITTSGEVLNSNKLGTITLGGVLYRDGENAKVEVANNTITLNIDGSLNEEATYTGLIIDGFEDAYGNMVESYEDTGYYFETADESGPSGYSVSIDQAYINNNNKTALSFTFANAEVGATYNYSIDDTNSGTLAVSNNGTITSATQQVSNIDVSGLDDDTLTLTVYLTDTSSNQGGNTTDTVTKDIVTPSGYSISIDQSKIINNNQTALSFTFTNAEVGATYSYSIDDLNGSTPAVSSSGTISSTTQQISNIDVSSLDDDTLTLVVYLTDSAGNQGSNSIDSITKDATIPSGYSVNIDQSYINNSNKTALSFTFANAEVGAAYNYSIDDTNSGTTAVSGSGTISSTTQQISSIDVSGLDDDILTLTVYLTDTNTNQGIITTDIVTKDILAPNGYTVNINQNVINNSNKSALSFTFANAEIGATYNYSIDDTNSGTTAVTGSATVTSATAIVSNIDVSGLDDDTLTLTVYLTDPAGNQGSNTTDTVTKDVTAPSGYSVSVNQAKIDNSNKSALSFTFANVEVGATYNYSIDDTNSGTTAVSSSGTISTATDTISNIDVSGLDDDTLTLTVYLTDSAGNQGSNTTDTVAKDVTAPSGYSVNIDQGYINNSNKAAMSFTFANAEVGATYNYSIDDTNSGTTAVSSSGTISTATDTISNIDVSGLDDDTLTLTVYLTDTSSNQGGNTTDIVTKDIVAPSGYSVNIDQAEITGSNKAALSFTFASAEVGATYNYSIDDTKSGTTAVSSSGTISTATDTISNIDVSGLDDDTLTVTVYLTDPAGNQGSNTTDTVTKDATAPSGYSVNIDQGYINNSNKTAMSFTFASAEVGATYNYSIDDTNSGTTAVSSSGTISSAIQQISNIDVSGLDDDTLTLTVYLTDTSSNQGTNTTDTVTKDMIAPSGYSVNINQGYINNGNKAALSFTFANAEVGATYNYSIDDTNSGTTSVSSSGTISTATDTISNIDVSGLDDDTLTLTVYLTDPAGNQGSNTTDIVTKDVTAPSGYTVSVNQAKIDNSNKEALSFIFANAEVGATYNYSIDDTNSGTTAVSSSGTISTATDAISNIDVSGLDDDTLTLTVYLTDSAGNQGSNTTDTVAKDVTAPSGYSVNINQGYINNGNKAALSFTFANAEVGATYNYSVDDTNSGTTAVSSSGTISSATQQITSIDVSSLDDDTLTLTVYLTDTSSNQGNNTTDTVTKDIVAPSGYSVNIDQAKIIGSNKAALSFTFASAQVGATYNYSIDDTNSGTTAVSSSGTINSATQQISNIDVSSLDDGTLTLTVYLTDPAGNQGSNTTDTVAKDATAPSGYSVNIDQGYINNSNKPAMSFTFASAEVGATYNYSVDDTNSGTTAVSSSGTISSSSQQISNIDVSGLDDDTLTLTVYLTDTSTNQGNNTTDTVTKDIVAPTGYTVNINQSLINSSNKTALSFTFADAEVGATYNYSIDDSNSGTTAITGSATVASATATVSNINVSTLDDDTLTLTVYLTDPAGNQGSNTTDTVAKDATAPSGYSVNIDQGYINNSNKTALSFTFASAEVGATYNYSIDDTNSGTTAVSSSGTISSSSQQISNIDVSSLDDDTLTLTVYLTDTNSNQGNNVTDTVVKDIVAPSGYTVNIDQSYVNNSNKGAVSFTFANAEFGATYNYSLDDTNSGTTAIAASGTAGSATHQVTSINATSLDDDTLTLTVYMTDAAGNQGSSTTDTVTKDVVAPTGYSVSIDQSSITSSNETALSFTFSSAEVGTTYTYSIDDTNSGTTAVTNNASVGSTSQQVTGINVSSLDDDALTLTVYLTDTAGNQGASDTATVAKDTTAPTNATNYPTADSATGTGFTVKAKTDEAGTAYYVVVADGATAPSATQVKNGQDSSGASATKSGNFALTANTEASSAVTGLTGGTAYDVYVVCQDSGANLQSSPEKVDISTTVSNPSTLTVNITGDWAPYDDAGEYSKIDDDYNSTGRPRYRRIGSSGTYYINWDGAKWILVTSGVNLHTNSSTATTVPKTGWQTTDGSNTQATISY